MPLLKRDTPVPAGTFSLQDVGLRAEQILAEARQNAGLVLAQMRSDADVTAARALQEARNRGEAEGVRAGREQALREERERVLKETRARFEQLEQALANALRDFEQRKHALLAEAESGIIHLAWAIAKRVCKTLGTLEANVAAENTKQLLQLVRHHADVTIRLHPADAKELPAVAPELCATLATLQCASIVEDPALARGDSVVSSAEGEVDARIDQQLDAIAAALAITPRTAVARPDGRGWEAGGSSVRPEGRGSEAREPNERGGP